MFGSHEYKWKMEAMKKEKNQLEPELVSTMLNNNYNAFVNQLLLSHIRHITSSTSKPF